MPFMDSLAQNTSIHILPGTRYSSDPRPLFLEYQSWHKILRDIVEVVARAVQSASVGLSATWKHPAMHRLIGRSWNKISETRAAAHKEKYISTIESFVSGKHSLHTSVFSTHVSILYTLHSLLCSLVSALSTSSSCQSRQLPFLEAVPAALLSPGCWSATI